MSAPCVVECFDVPEDSAMCIDAHVERFEEQAFGFDRVENGLGDRVVVTTEPLALADAGFTQELAELFAAVLASAVGVKDRILVEHAAAERASHGRDDECRVDAAGCGPADDLSGTDIEDDRQIQPSFTRPDVGDVAGEELHRSLCVEVAPHQIRHHDRSLAVLCRDVEQSSGLGYHVVKPHQAGDAGFADMDVHRREVIEDTVAAVGAITGHKDAGDHWYKFPIGHGACARGSLQ